jgi:SNF2 family DNA or RNA helicase
LSPDLLAPLEGISVPLFIVGELSSDRTHIVLMAAGREVEVASASRLMQTCTPAAKASKPAGGLVIPLSWGATVQLASTFGHAWKPQPRLATWIAEQITARLATDVDQAAWPAWALPEGLVPRSYQLSAAQLIANQGGGLLFDEMGTGKTVSAILGVRELDRLGRDPFPCVVVSPASVVDGWVEHFSNWMPGVRVTPWRGTPAQRRELIGSAEVYVSSYDTARNDARSADKRESPLMALSARTLISDEMHRLKTRSAKQSQAVRRLAKKAEHFIGLSGTPITHHPGNLWPALVCLEPAAWPSYERWANRYLLTIPGDYGENVLGLHPAREAEFRLGLLGQTRRVAKADVLTELPPKIYSVRTVELPPDWRQVYDSMESEMLASLPDGEELSVMGVLAQLTRLSQLACAPADVTTTVEVVNTMGLDEEVIHTTVALKAPSWKVDALLDVLEERCDPGGGAGGSGEQVVVFAPSRQLIVLAGAAAVEAGYRVGYVVGGQKMPERTEVVKRFQAGELDLLCVTTAAGGEGITLTAARTCVFLQRPWSMGEAVQCEDRLHRIGAERHDSIEVIDIVAANTIDTRVRAVIREKGKQFSDLVQDPRVVETLLGGAGVSRRKVERRLRVVS